MGVTPHAFQIVVGALFFLKEVDDDITVVHEHPAAFGRAFHGEGQLGEAFFDLFADGFGQGTKLTVAVAGADDKVIGDDGIRSQIQQNNVFGFFIFHYIDDIAG